MFEGSLDRNQESRQTDGYLNGGSNKGRAQRMLKK